MLSVPAPHHLPHLVHEVLLASFFFIEIASAISSMSTTSPTSVPPRNFLGLGFMKIAFHLFNYVHKLHAPVPFSFVADVAGPASFFVFLSFIDGCMLNHLVQFRFPLHTFFTAFVPRIRCLFHSGPHCVDLSRDLLPFPLRLCTSPLISCELLSTFFPGRLPPTRFCPVRPLFVLPSFTLFGHGTPLKRTLLFHCRQSHSLGEGARGRN